MAMAMAVQPQCSSSLTLAHCPCRHLLPPHPPSAASQPSRRPRAICQASDGFKSSREEMNYPTEACVHSSPHFQKPQHPKSSLETGAWGASSHSVFFSVAPFIYTDIAEGAGYSQASYYTSLGLFLLSLPGLWSLIKRSTKSKIVKKTFLVPGSVETNGKAPKQIAGEISSFFLRNNFEITDRGDAITFEGVMVPSRGQAAFLSFCTCLSLASVALVLSITVPDVGDKWYWLMGFSPLAGVYYWTKASRKEQIKVKMIVADNQASTDVIVQGDDEQVDLLRRELKLLEKGMVYVKGILER